MITTVLNTAVAIPFTLFDAAVDAVTGKVNGDFTKSAYLASTPATTATPTVTEVSGGDYVVSVTPTATGNWYVRWSVDVDGETVPFAETVQVVTAAQFDPFTYLAGGSVTLVSPVDGPTNAVSLYQADDYDADESRSLDWSTTDSGTWPTLTSATVALIVTHGIDATIGVTVAGSVITPTGDTKQVRVELTHAQTAALTPGSYKYQLVATLANGHVVTLAAGALTLSARLGT